MLTNILLTKVFWALVIIEFPVLFQKFQSIVYGLIEITKYKYMEI